MTNGKEYATEHLDLPAADAKKINRLLQGSLDPETFSSVKSHLRQCYHQPSWVSLVLLACNEVLGGHGVEPLYGHEHWDAYHGKVEASHVNMGDCYIPTVIRDHRWDAWAVTTVGDFMEKHDGRFR